MSKEFITWDLKAIESTEPEELQKSLDEGYEPFAVTQMMKPVKSNVVQMQPQGPNGGMAVVQVIWFKRPNVNILEEKPNDDAG
ncbi:MAG: hypothetical protein H7836_04350 [Magnetococcus sp. YQC-3]